MPVAANRGKARVTFIRVSFFGSLAVLEPLKAARRESVVVTKCVDRATLVEAFPPFRLEVVLIHDAFAVEREKVVL